MRVALLSYRSKEHCGGQGVYVRQLSRGLVDQGHEVEVFSGQPYPVLDPRVRLTKVPSLDLYRETDPFRTPKPGEFRDLIDVLELASMWTAGFPEPLTFSLRVARLLREREGEFDVVHDNQSLGYGLRALEGRLPLVATVHHPITRDRATDLRAAPLRRKLPVWRWYGFLRMQARVARRISDLLTVSEASASAIAADFGVDPSSIRTIPLGVDTRTFRPSAGPRVPGRIVAVASAEVPLKGVAHLLEAVAKLSTERDVELVLVSKLNRGGTTERLIEELRIGDRVTAVSGLTDEELAGLLASAQVACVPSLYEGFSLPAVEAMAAATPVVASRVGALPEVVGPDGECGRLVPPGDAGELAQRLGSVLDDADYGAALGAAGRRRVLEHFSWDAVAKTTAEAYTAAIERHRDATAR